MTALVVLAIVLAWLLVGAMAGLIDARRGHWSRGWVVAALLGPAAFALSRAGRAREGQVAPTVVSEGAAAGGSFDVLVGIDGSPAAACAGEQAARLLGAQIGRLTLAIVLDYDTAEPHSDSVLYPGPWEEETVARAQLEAAATRMRNTSDLDPGSVMLAGNPADAISSYARSEGYDLIVVGSRGKRITKLVLGSCASRLAGASEIPVLIVPAAAPPAG